MVSRLSNYKWESNLIQRGLGFIGLLLCVPGLVCALSNVQTQDHQAAEGAILKALKKVKIRSVQVVIDDDATAIVSGRVRNVFSRDQVIEIALAQRGILAVESEMEISTAESDQKLGEEVIKAIQKYSRFDLFDDAGASVQDGHVALFGFVTEPHKKIEIEQRMTKILGIQAFENNIEVLPNSISDERLRSILARRLYYDLTFEHYSSMTHKPIRIIVKNSRVLLTGVVQSQLEKIKAMSIIRQTPGVLSVENKLRISR